MTSVLKVIVRKGVIQVKDENVKYYSISERAGDARACSNIGFRLIGKPKLLAILASVLPALIPGLIDVGLLCASATLLIPSKADPEGDGVVPGSGVTVEDVAGTAGSDSAVVAAALLVPLN
jgi:hypothetical protein